MSNLRLPLALTGLFLATQVLSQPTAPNNKLQGRVLYQSSGNKPAAGVQIREKDSNGDYSKDKGDYRLIFQKKRNGEVLSLEISPDTREGKKIELVNEKEVKAAKLPASAEEVLDIIVCPAGQRDIAAQKYYRILRTTADRELERKKKEVEGLLAQKEKDYQKISDLFAQLDGMQAALDSAKIREQAFSIASINLDRASQMVKDAVKKINEENDVEGALRILSAEALDTAYLNASALKKKAEAAIRQVIEGYEFKISLLEPQFRYGEMAECYERIAMIYEKEDYDKKNLADILVQAAISRKFNGDFQKALEFNLKAVAIFEKVLPADHPDLAMAYSNLAGTYADLGEFEKDLEFNLKALAIFEKALPADHPDLATSIANQAATYGNIGQHQKQLELDLKALAIFEKALPADHPLLASSYNNLAGTYNLLGEYQKALEFNLKALAIREKALPADHRDLAWSYNDLAITYFNLGEHQKALAFIQKALNIFEKILPADHPFLANSYNNLAQVYGNLGEQQKQLEMNLKALAIREKVLPADHFELAITYNNLALTYNDRSEYHKGLEYNLKAAAILEQVLPAEHPHLAKSYHNLATNYTFLGDYQKALALHVKALSIWEKTLPPNHSDLLISFSNIGGSYRDVGNYRQAVEYGQKAIRLGEASNPKPDYLNRFYANLGITYVKARRYPEAKAALEKCESLKMEEKVYRGWAMYYALQKKKKQALESLQKAVALGFKDLKWLETEPDLKNIRREKGYKELVEQLQKQ